jgi:hypothetical protein
METKKYTQYGKFSILILIPMILLFLGWWIKYRYSEGLNVMFPLYTSIFLFILLIMMYRLTITITETHLSFKMGIGLIHKSFKLTDITSCRPVTNYLTGYGIRLLRNGWLYNVSGFKSIELKLINRKSVIRIGTDRPDEICATIQQLKGTSSLEETVEEAPPNYLRSRYIFIIIILVLFGAFIISVKQEKKVIVENNEINIKGLYGIKIPFSDITEIDTLTVLPQVKMKTNGYADGNTLVGYFRMGDNSKAKLFIKKKAYPYLMIKSKHTVAVYLNYKDRSKTAKLYEEIKSKMMR